MHGMSVVTWELQKCGSVVWLLLESSRGFWSQGRGEGGGGVHKGLFVGQM